MRLIILLDQLLIVALVSHYLTNKLMERSLLLRRRNFPLGVLNPRSVRGISLAFAKLSPCEG